MRQWVREALFNAWDSVRGRPVYRAIAEIERLNQNQEAASEAAHNRLDRLLAHAVKHTTFYEPYRDRRFTEFPIVNKTTILAETAAFLSVDPAQQRLHKATTSGSTGTPFYVFHSREKRQRIAAEAIYFGREAGYVPGMRLHHIKIWSARNRKGPLLRWAQNVEPVDALHFDEESAGVLLAGLRLRPGVNAIIGYSSAVRTIGQVLNAMSSSEIHALREGARLLSVVAQSEALDEETREVFGRQLDVVPVGRYGLEELGIVAQQRPRLQSPYFINTATHIVELLDLDDDNPIAPGNLGRLVVTDLFSSVQPLIRYDTGDLAVGDKMAANGLGYETLSEIQGRRMDQVFDVDDKPLSPFLFYRFSFKYPEVAQFQFVQEAKGTYSLRVNAKSDAGLEVALMQDLGEILGPRAMIGVEFVDEVPALSSGKRRLVVSNYVPSK